MRRQLVPAALTLALAACTTAPPKKTPSPVVITPVAPDRSQQVPPLEAPAAPDPWQRLRDSFAMADCEADPSIMAWARTYTRSPARFESQLAAALPRLAYVQEVASQYDVAGEFVLLPWVESHFQPVASRARNRPAGMWQIMPATAAAMGLRVDSHYDGRLDVPAAAHAVMKALRRYHERFHDWRVADYAYNAGEFAVGKLIRTHGAPAAEPAIPALPVRPVTREHLAKLLAIACVVRQPERFGVTLPTLSPEHQLVKVPLGKSLPVARAADHAGMDVDRFKHLNAAFRSDTIDANKVSYLMLPAEHAQQFRTAVVEQSTRPLAEQQDTAPETDATAPDTPAPPRHTVKPGDSLWGIAKRYAVSVGDLERWNRLRGPSIKPGLVLQVGAGR